MTITKFFFMVWIGVGDSQSISVLTFDTLSECNGIKDSMIENVNYWHGVETDDVECHPYTFEAE